LQREKYSDPETAPRPDLTLLDLNLPKLNGKEVRERIREHPELARIPTVALTTSRQERDIVATYDLGVNSFITKPVDMGQFVRVVQALEE